MEFTSFIFYFIGLIITYFVVKKAVKRGISESLEDIKIVIKKAILLGLSEYDYKKKNE